MLFPAHLLWQLQVCLVLAFSSRGILALCPNGFFEQGGVCVQIPPSCGANQVLINGLCYPAQTQPPPTGGCNQAATPCPYSPVTPCATQPAVPPCTAVQPAVPCSSAVAPPCQTACGIYGTPPCSATPCAQAAAPCGVQPTTPCANAPATPCGVQPATPCANAPAAPCRVQPATPCANAPATPCGVQPVAPCPIAPPTYPPVVCPPPPTNAPPTYAPPTSPPSTYPPPTPPPPTYPPRTPPPPTYAPPTPPPPANIESCPPGTILMNGQCRLIYCGKNGVYRGDRCVQTVCPAGTIWTGIKCANPEPIVHNIVYNNTVITHFNHTQPDVIINNVNNLVVNASIAVPPQAPCEHPDVDGNCAEEPEVEAYEEPPPQTTVSPPTKQPCCTVITPRTCTQGANGERWNCYSKRYRQCSDMCVAPTIHLRAPRVYQPQPQTVIMPPNPQFAPCGHSAGSGGCARSSNNYDCSGCAAGRPESCASYCYQTRCSSHRCQFYDQRDYCANMGAAGGAFGCRQQDGCYEDWCGGGY